MPRHNHKVNGWDNCRHLDNGGNDWYKQGIQIDDHNNDSTYTGGDKGHTHNITLTSTTTGSTGSDGAHNNVQPYIAQNFIIKAKQAKIENIVTNDLSGDEDYKAPSVATINDVIDTLNTSINSKAPKSHASTTTTYGVGTTTSYGHCMTINNLTTSSHSNGKALSAYQGYVLKTAIDTVSNNLNKIENYSTSEVKTAQTWIDGKPIYKKTISIGSLTKGVQKTGDTGIRNWDNIVEQCGTAFNGTNYEKDPDFFCYVNGSTLRYSAYNSVNAVSKCYLTVYYTKTTD